MKNIKLIVLTIAAALSTSVWAQKTYTFDDGVALETDWKVTKDVPDGGKGECSIASPSKFTEKSGNYLYFVFENKSKITLTVTTTASYNNISNISFDAVANDNSKPDFTLNIVDDNGNVVKNIYSNKATKADFNTGGTNKWGVSNEAISPAVSGHVQLVLYASSSGKYAAIDNLAITYSAGPAAASTDATLKRIVYGSDETPIPNFTASQLDYEVELPYDYIGGAPSVQAEANHSKATVSITPATSLPGTATIDVTAEDGTTKLQYTVTFARASANPKVLTATWDNIEGTATIDQVNKTITGKVKNGSSLTLTPTFTGNNIKSWFPDDATDFSNGAVEYVFSSPTGPTETYNVTITEAPAAPAEDYCAELYPAATGGTPAKGAEVALKAESHGGKIIFADAKDDNFEASFTYTEFGLQMNKGGKDSVRVVLESLLQVGSVIKLDIYQSSIDNKERGFKLLTSGKQSVLDAIWVPTDEDKERTVEYTVVAGDGIEGKASFLIQRSNSAVLKAVLVTNCADSTPTPPTPVVVESVTLNKKTLTLEAGQTETLTATVKPDNADNKNITWKSDNTTVATVDATGKVSALVAGTANIIVKTEDQEKTDTCAVTVTEPASQIEVESISIKNAMTLDVGDSETLSVTYMPENANTGKAITWTSDKPGIAKVDADGKVTAVAAGTAVIKATTENGKTASCTVTVNKQSSQIDTDLDLHEPEKYEASTIAGGYNTPLTEIGGREYEVYYTEHTDKTKYPTFSTTPVEECKTEGISGSTSETKNEGREGDKWFEGTIASTSECKSASSKDEFVFASKTIREHRLGATDTYQFHVKGFDQFSLWGMDKKIDPKNGNQVFVVKVDGKEQPTDESLYNTSKYTIRRYDITTDEHLIEISTTCSGSNVCYMGGFSLRVAQEPRTKWLKGNDSTQNVVPFGAIAPVTYVTKYNNISGAETKLEWIGAAVDGLGLKEIEGDLTDTLVLNGTANAPAGEYHYAVVAYFNGKETTRAEGKFKIHYEINAITKTDVSADQGEEIDEIKCRYYVYDETKDIIVKWNPEAGAPGIKTSAKNGIFSISGTPTTVGTYAYLVTVEGGDTVQGTIRVESSDLGENPVLYLYKNKMDYIYDYLKESGYNLKAKCAKDSSMRSAEQYAKYKWVLISENVDANSMEVFHILRGGSRLPVLNMKAFSYSFAVDSLPYYGEAWGVADNGSISENGKSITVWRDDHPIFKALGKKQGDTIQVLDSINRRGLMPVKVTKTGGLCLATAWTRDREDYYGDGARETFIHEIPAGMSGNDAKYISLPISMNSSLYLTEEGKELLKATIAYLTNDKPSVARPELKISQFKVLDKTGTIYEGMDGKNTITLEIDSTLYPDTDWTHIVPEIEVASPYTYAVCEKCESDSIDLLIAQYIPIEYVVTDYIHRVSYDVKVVWRKAQGIEEVYSVGDWVNVYDIFGRKVATTNEDIYTMSLPRGVYIIVTENGQTLKISR